MARRDGEHLILDIETVPDLARWSKPDLPPGVEAPFPPTWAHRVIVVGCMLLDGDYRIRRLGVVGEGKDLGTDPDERALLFELSRFVGKHRPLIVTYNGRSFDLPVIAPALAVARRPAGPGTTRSAACAIATAARVTSTCATG